MHVPPVVRGGLAARAAALLLGLALFALAIVLILESELGLSPWDVLNQGIAERTPLSFGIANVAVALPVLALSWTLGARIGVGTVANAVLVGLMVDGFSAIAAIGRLSETAVGVRVALLVAGLLLIGLASGLYIGADLGAGPRDSLMLVSSQRTGIRIGVVRTGLEVAVTVAGVSLGGTVGLGTLAFAVAVGWLVELGFWALVALRLARRRPATTLQPATIDAR